MKPIRRKENVQVTDNPTTGQDQVLEFMQEEDVLSHQGSIDSSNLHRKFFRDCGCDGPIGGRCFECSAISCVACHGRCQNCQKPICMQHSNFLEKDDGEKERLCGTCYDAIIRRQGWAKVFRFFKSLVFEMEDESHD